MGHLVGHSGGDHAGRGVDVHVGLSGEGEIHPGKAQNTLEPGEKEGLYPHRGLQLQKGKLLDQVLIDGGAPVKDLLQGLGKQAVPVPLHLGGELRRLLGKQGGHLGQGLHRVGLYFESAPLLKAGGVVGGVPHPAHRRPQPQQGGAEGQQAAQKAPARPLPDQQDHGPDEPGGASH